MPLDNPGKFDGPLDKPLGGPPVEVSPDNPNKAIMGADPTQEKLEMLKTKFGYEDLEGLIGALAGLLPQILGKGGGQGAGPGMGGLPPAGPSAGGGPPGKLR